MTAENCEVLIVGGGPVGLTLATELAWRGRRPLLIDQTTGVVDHPRAGGISIRTMEHCRRWGISKKVLNAGFNLDLPLNQRFCTSVVGWELGTSRYPSLRQLLPPPESPEKLVRCRQMWLDPIFADTARAHGAHLRYEHRMEKFEQDAEGVTCDVLALKSGERSKIRAKYMVACDGITGTVRDTLGIPLEGRVLGQSVSVLFRANIYDLIPDPAERFIIITPDGPVANITAMDGYQLFRFILRRGDDFDPKTFDAEAHIRRAINSPDAKVEVLSVRPWRRSLVLAEHFQEGRVFLAGDSAHVMVPTGGFGANTGIGDAVDLGWKLDAVLSGWGGPRLLDSYEIERRPVVARNTDAAARNHEAWTPRQDLHRLLEDSPAGADMRKAVGEELVEATRAEFESTGISLGYAYHDSPICVPDGTLPPPDDARLYTPVARPGHRAPHIWLADGSSTLDLFGRGFSLLRFDDDDHSGTEHFLASAKFRHVPVHVHEVRDPAARAAYDARLVIVRPDGHVAWRGNSLTSSQPLLDTIVGA